MTSGITEAEEALRAMPSDARPDRRAFTTASSAAGSSRKKGGYEVSTTKAMAATGH
jgi:hypothetical protein